MRYGVVSLLLAAAASQASGDEVSLRLAGKELALEKGVEQRLSALAREMLRRCGPNTKQHPSNFGLAGLAVAKRWQETMAGSRLRVRFAEPLISESHLGGALGVSEAIIGLESADLFVGPSFTRHGESIVEHLQCEYLPALEIACTGQLAPHLAARYRETCAKFERDAAGRIVMPPPDIAPSCS